MSDAVSQTLVFTVGFKWSFRTLKTTGAHSGWIKAIDGNPLVSWVSWLAKEYAYSSLGVRYDRLGDYNRTAVLEKGISYLSTIDTFTDFTKNLKYFGKILNIGGWVLSGKDFVSELINDPKMSHAVNSLTDFPEFRNPENAVFISILSESLMSELISNGHITVSDDYDITINNQEALNEYNNAIQTSYDNLDH